MPRKLPALLAAGLVLALTTVTARAGAPDEDAKQIAVKVTTAGAAMFDARDAKGLALTYVEDARLEIIIKDKDSGELKTETKVGRAEIEAYYRELFGKSNEPIHARNAVEFARLLDADLLTISGVFEPDTERAEPLKLPFIQVRARRGGEWRVVSLQVYVVPQK
jgi:hypothetical protein